MQIRLLDEDPDPRYKSTLQPSRGNGFVAGRRLSLARPFKAGITRPQSQSSRQRRLNGGSPNGQHLHASTTVKRTFQEEYLEFLIKNGIEYDERYLWG